MSTREVVFAFLNENEFTFFIHSLYVLHHNLFLTVIYHGHYVLLINEALMHFLNTAALFQSMYLTPSPCVDI